jgi:hypothetical protein
MLDQRRFTAFEPLGKTVEAKVNAILDRRVKWLEAHPEAATCTIVVSRANTALAWYLSKVDVPWVSLSKGGPTGDVVWFADGGDL